MSAREHRILVVGAGIGGLAAALSLHEIGASVDVFETVRELRPLGVGINLLPHAVRELDAARVVGAASPTVGRADEPGVLLEPGPGDLAGTAGTTAGYSWPQLSINRGALQQVLVDAFNERVGPDHLHLGHRLERIDADDMHAERGVRH